MGAWLLVGTGTINGMLAMALGVYLLMVFSHGNIPQLVDRLSQETGFAEFLVAVALVQWGIEHDPSGLSKPLVALGMFGGMLAVTGHLDIVGATRDFATGRKSLFETIGSMVK